MSSRKTTIINIDENYKLDTILRTFILFAQTAREVLKYADAQVYREARLSVIQLITLQSLAVNNGVMTPSEIAEWTQTERHNITTLVKRMKKSGLVIAERNSNDKRIVNVILTKEGREVLNQTILVAKKVVNQVMLSITEDDANVLEKLLRIIRQNAHSGFERLRPVTGGNSI